MNRKTPVGTQSKDGRISALVYDEWSDEVFRLNTREKVVHLFAKMLGVYIVCFYRRS